MDSNTVDSVKNDIVKLLEPVYGKRESLWIVRALLEDVMGWTMNDIVLRGDYVLEDFTAQRLKDMALRIAHGEPVQYVTGKAPFYGMTFNVAPGVLIPRPETAQLVDLIVKENSSASDLRVLDCGTGSGCIAIALSRNLPFARVTAIDNQDVALKIARENAYRLKAKITFENADLLHMPPARQDAFDIIVSNPPYIAESERSDMKDNVLEHEPATALFVPDNDPLLFYRAIAQYAQKALSPHGRLYFEINPLYADRLTEMLQKLGFDTTLQRDAQGKLRFTISTRHDS